VPVYLWAPLVPAVGKLRAPERLGARIANLCAVGTTLIRRNHGSAALSLAPSTPDE
jgi:hypothetical protein